LIVQRSNNNRHKFCLNYAPRNGRMIAVDGTIVQGLGAASVTVPQQWPTVIRFIPTIQSCEQRTINVQLRHALHIQQFDLSLYVPWGNGAETISFVEIEFEYPVNGSTRPAWIYFPHNSPRRQNSFFVEIITAKIPNLVPLSDCRLILKRAAFVI
jgi:hypothetical protein